MSDRSLSSKPYFCALPWMALYVATDDILLPCCMSADCKERNDFDKTKGQNIVKIYNSKGMKDLRANMLNDVPSAVCEQCYQTEHYRESSHRINSNNRWLNKELETRITDQTTPDGEVSTVKIIAWDVRFSNVCNYKCRMCGHPYSTGWNADAKLLYRDARNIPDKLFSLNGDVLGFCEKNRDHLKDLEYAYFAGGEPLVQPEYYLFLDWCIQNDITPEIYMQSNGSILKYSKYEVLEQWKKFKLVTYGLSIEGLGPMGEYIRTGFKTENVLNNLQKITDYFSEGNKGSLLVNPVIMVYNAFFVTEFFDELVATGFVTPYSIWSQLALNPEFMQPKVLPKALKVIAADKILKSEWYVKYPEKVEFVLNNMEEDSTPKLWSQFKEHTIKLDAIRNENILSYFPELAPYYNDENYKGL